MFSKNIGPKKERGTLNLDQDLDGWLRTITHGFRKCHWRCDAMWGHVTLLIAVQHNKNGNWLHHRWTIGKPYGQSPKRYNVTLMWRSKWRHYNVTVTTLWRHCDAKRDASVTSAWRTKMRFLRIEEWIPKVVFQPHSKKKDLDRQFEADGQSINRFTFCPFALSLSLTHTHTHTHNTLSLYLFFISLALTNWLFFFSKKMIRCPKVTFFPFLKESKRKVRVKPIDAFYIFEKVF